jgi:hypothetical protein
LALKANGFLAFYLSATCRTSCARKNATSSSRNSAAYSILICESYRTAAHSAKGANDAALALFIAKPDEF